MSSSEVEKCRRAIENKKKSRGKVPLEMHYDLCDALKKDNRAEEAAQHYIKLLKSPDDFTERDIGIINHEIGSCYMDIYDFKKAYKYLSEAKKYIRLGDEDFRLLADDIETSKKYQKVQMQIQQLEKNIRLIRERGAVTLEDKKMFVTSALEASEQRLLYGDTTPDHFIPLFVECEKMLQTESNTRDLLVSLYFYWNEVLYENAKYDESSEILNKLLSVLCESGEISDRKIMLIKCLTFMGNTRAKISFENNNDDDYEEEIVMETYSRAENEIKECMENTKDESEKDSCNNFMNMICMGKAEFYHTKGNIKKYEKWLAEASKYKPFDGEEEGEEEEENEEGSGDEDNDDGNSTDSNDGDNSRSSSSSSSDSDDESCSILSDDYLTKTKTINKPAEKRKDEPIAKRRREIREDDSDEDKPEDIPVSKKSRLEEIVRQKKIRDQKAKESLQFSSSNYDAEGNLKPCFRNDFFDNDLGETFDDEDDNEEEGSNSSSSSSDEEDGYNNNYNDDDDSTTIYETIRANAPNTTKSNSSGIVRQSTNKYNTLDRFLMTSETQYNKLSPSLSKTSDAPIKRSRKQPSPQPPPLPPPPQQQQRSFIQPRPIVVQPPSTKKKSLVAFFSSPKQTEVQQQQQLQEQQQQQEQQLQNNGRETNEFIGRAQTMGPGNNIIVQVNIDLYNFSTKFSINESQCIGDITRKAVERYELTRKQRLAIGMDLELRGSVLVEDDCISGLIQNGDTLKLVPQAITPDTPGVNPRVRAAVSATNVSTVSLSGVKLDELSFRALCGALPSLASLERLELRGCGLCAKHALALSNALQSTGELHELDVSHNPLECGASPAELQGIASLFYVATLESLDISAARLSSRTLELLADSAGTIIGVPNVRRIDVSGNQLGPSLPLFVRAISNLTRLSELRAGEIFQRCTCDDKGDGERFPAALRTLRFSGNTLGDAGAAFLAAALPPGIRFVDVAGCALGPVAARALMCSGTEALDISNNDVGAELASALSNNCVPKLAALKASRCGLGMAGLSMVLRAAAGCSYLAVLIVDENVPLAAGQSQINVLASKCFPQLTFLDLSRNGVTKEDAESLAQMWKKAHDGSAQTLSTTSLSPHSGTRISNVTITDSALVFGDRSIWQKLIQDSTKRRKD